MKKINSFICTLMITLMLFGLSVTSFAADEKHPDPATPATPANVTVTPSSNSVTIKWDKAEKATGYRVFRKTSKGWVKCVTTKKTTATVKKLTPATKYTFAVRSYNLCTCGKITWSAKYTTCKTATTPGKIAKVNTKTTASNYKVTWSASKGADGYELYYKSFGKWVKFAETTDNKGSLVRLIPGKKYSLAIRPYVKVDDGRVYGEYKTFTAVLGPNAPKVEASSPAEGKLKIKWNSVLGADGYRVYYKVGNGSYKAYKNFAKGQEIEIANLKAGNYTVAVRAYMKTADGNVYSTFTPVKVTVKAVDPTPNCPHD